MFSAMPLNKEGRPAFGFGMTKEENDLFMSMDETERSIFLFKRKAQVESERKFHIEWGIIAIKHRWID